MLIAPLLVAAAVAPPFTPRVDNPYFPARPGMRWVYRGVEEGKRSRDVVRVTRHVEFVAGVPCATVRDRLYLNGRLAEDTIDWYSEDAGGTVWYFGEATKELDRRGRVKSTEGSWRAGVHGARQGIVMPRRPRAGQEFRQEFLAGHAEDRFRVLSANSAGVATREWTPLEPGVIDRKWYAFGVGMIREKSQKGPRERADLVEFLRG